jgi:prepilin-type N-terminal cleavage/methylation domain-containing protein
VAARNVKRVLKRSLTRGFSLTELLVSVLILVILVVISVPTLMRAYRSYQLSDAATRLSGELKTARFTAIRRNTPQDCRVQHTGAIWTAWTDMNRDGVAQTTEPQVIIGSAIQMLGSGGSVPTPDAIVAALGANSPSLGVLSPGNSVVTFDQRGARQFSGGPSVGIYYLGNPAISGLGYRAVVLLPSGNVQVWSAGPGGPWFRVG